LTTSDLTLIIKKISEANDQALKNAMESTNKAIREFTNPLQGLATWSHPAGTNAYTFSFNSLNDLEKALPKVKKIPNIALINIKPDHLKEVSDTLNEGDHFKAFTLCVSLYESYGKTILIRKFKDKPNLVEDLTDRLGVNNIIIMLYIHGLIDENTYSQMISVNKTRNAFIHSYLTFGLSDDLAIKIKDNIPRIKRSLKALREIYDGLPKE